MLQNILMQSTSIPVVGEVLEIMVRKIEETVNKLSLLRKGPHQEASSRLTDDNLHAPHNDQSQCSGIKALNNCHSSSQYD